MVVLGGLYGSQPVGRELVIRLARHLGAGWAKKDVKIQTLLEKTRIFLVPAVDIDGYDAALPGIFNVYFSFFLVSLFSPYVFSPFLSFVKCLCAVPVCLMI